MSERACADTWTCQVTMRDGKLPALEKLSSHIEDIRVGASLRGAEAALSGRLIEEDGRHLLRVSFSGEVLRLAPLTRKVQRDPESKGDEPPSSEERGAYERLCGELTGRRTGVQVVGPLREGGGDRRILEVRSYRWDQGRESGTP